MTTTPERHPRLSARKNSSMHHLLEVADKHEQVLGYAIGQPQVETGLPVEDYAIPAERHIEVTFPESAPEVIPVTTEHTPSVDAERASRSRKLALGFRALAGSVKELLGTPNVPAHRARSLGATSLNAFRSTGGTHKLQPGKHRRQIGKHRA